MDRSAPPTPILAPIFRIVVYPIQAFFRLEAASGILLFLSAAVALALANSPAAALYEEAIHYPLGLTVGTHTVPLSVHGLVNDGLMTVFFFVVGMEIKGELVRGELRTPARAALPAIAALGGMAAPAAIYLAVTWGTPGSVGWGIPMATDIAFCIGCLTLLRRRVSHALIVFVTALAIFDDIGGILVIAIFYGEGIHAGWLAAAGGVTAALIVVNRLQVRAGLCYLLGGAALWYALHHAGIHATIAGVVLGLVVPARPARDPRHVLGELDAHATSLLARAPDQGIDNASLLEIQDKLADVVSPLDRFVHLLHPWVAFGVMPLFALVNSGVTVTGVPVTQLAGPVAIGVALGLFVGKPIGVFLFTAVTTGVGVAPRPGGASLGKIYGVATLAGIGFTVALFIASLAFAKQPGLLVQAKIGILAGSLASGLAGVAVLRLTRAIQP